MFITITLSQDSWIAKREVLKLCEYNLKNDQMAYVCIYFNNV